MQRSECEQYLVRWNLAWIPLCGWWSGSYFLRLGFVTGCFPKSEMPTNNHYNLNIKLYACCIYKHDIDSVPVHLTV